MVLPRRSGGLAHTTKPGSYRVVGLFFVVFNDPCVSGMLLLCAVTMV
jgi:hypothetical protein